MHHIMKKGKTKHQETNQLEQTPRIPWLWRENQEENSPKTNKEASCGQIPNPEFSDWSERKKNCPVQKQFWREALKSTCKWSTNFLVKNQKRTRNDLRNPNNPFLQGLGNKGHRSIRLERRWRSWKMPKEPENSNCPSPIWLNWEPTPKVKLQAQKKLDKENLAKKGNIL